MRVAIGLMAKAPRAGQVKTRLAAAVGTEPAASLAAAFLRDSAARAAALARSLSGTALALHSPADAAPDFAELLPRGTVMAPQAEGDLGARMEAGCAALLRMGDVALLTGSDLPTLPTALLREAIQAIAEGTAGAAVVPVRDGGYGAIALGGPAPALFHGIAWSTGTVLSDTRAAAVRSGLRLHVTGAWYDVDSMSDLDDLRAELAGSPPPGCAALPGDGAPATRAALARLFG